MKKTILYKIIFILNTQKENIHLKCINSVSKEFGAETKDKGKKERERDK